MRKNKRGLPAGRQGFTLIEALVMIAVISSISAILIVNWRKSEKKYQLQRTAQEVVQNIRKVQNMALSGTESNDLLPDSYGISFDASTPNSYILFGDRNGNKSFQTATSDIVVSQITIEPGVELSLPRDYDITFTIPDGFVNIRPSAPGGSITITIKRTGKVCPSSDCKDITITTTGQINIE